MSANPVATVAPTAFFPMKRIAQALDVLRKHGIPIPGGNIADRPMVAIMAEISDLDQPKVEAVARTLAQAEIFNSIVRDQLTEVSIGNAYGDIAGSFDSIREDAKAMIDQLADGKIDGMERLRNMWMKFRRGTIADRFNDIKKSAEDLFGRTRDQIDREAIILDSYREFRRSIKEASVLAEDLVIIARGQAETARTNLSQAQEAVGQTAEGRPRAEADLARDQAMVEQRKAEKRYETTLDLVNNLTISYNTGDVVMTRLVQATDAKDRVWRQSVSFFSTNESVLTALSATFTATQGLHEATEGHKALKDGVNKSLETLADLGGKVLEDATREGHGPTTSAASLRKLLDSVVSFQEKNQVIAQEMRLAAEANAKDIRDAVEDGKARLTALATGQTPPPVPATLLSSSSSQA